MWEVLRKMEFGPQLFYWIHLLCDASRVQWKIVTLLSELFVALCPSDGALGGGAALVLTSEELSGGLCGRKGGTISPLQAILKTCIDSWRNLPLSLI